MIEIAQSRTTNATWPSGPVWLRTRRYASPIAPLLVNAAIDAARQVVGQITADQMMIIIAADNVQCDAARTALDDLIQHWKGDLAGLTGYLYEEMPMFSYVRGLPSVQGQHVARGVQEVLGGQVVATLASTAGDAEMLARRMAASTDCAAVLVASIQSNDDQQYSATAKIFCAEQHGDHPQVYLGPARVRVGHVAAARTELFAGLPCALAEAQVSRQGLRVDLATTEALAFDVVQQVLAASAVDGRLGVVYAPMWAGPGGSDAADWLERYRFGAWSDTELLQAALTQATGLDVMLHRVEATCAGGVRAVIEASRMVQSGLVKQAIAVASVARNNPYHLSQFAQLTALSTWAGNPAEASRPFQPDRAGLVMAEGAAAILVTSAETPTRILGWGTGVDISHPTAPSADMIEKVMRIAISDHEVSLVSAHGTGTKLNDQAELEALHRIFGPQLPELVALKARTGHASAASGIIEIADALARSGIVVKNSFGFGGQYASLAWQTLKPH